MVSIVHRVHWWNSRWEEAANLGGSAGGVRSCELRFRADMALAHKSALSGLCQLRDGGEHGGVEEGFVIDALELSEGDVLAEFFRRGFVVDAE